MNRKKSHIFTLIKGFFVFLIPLIFLSYHIDREIYLQQDRIEEDLQAKLLNAAKNINENLVPLNYLNKEFNKIHTNLFPNTPNELILGIPDESALKDLYNKNLLDKLVNLTKEKYKPIAITVGTQDLKEIYGYNCPELEKELKANNEEKEFLKAKSFMEMMTLIGKHKNSFFYELRDDKIKKYNEINQYLKQNKLSFKYFQPICFKYISRFKPYNRNQTPIYTDYFEKQTLYPIIKTTLSVNYIHGYYSILVPQKYVDPEDILNSVLSSFEQETNIELVNEHKKSLIEKEQDKLVYYLDYPTIFIHQIEAFKRLRNIDKSFLTKKHIKISLNFPREYIILKLINRGFKIIIPLSIFLFIFFLIKISKNTMFFKVKLLKKLIFILSLIILLPLTGIGLITLTISQNLYEIIDINVRKDLHNSLENYSLLKDEILARHLSSIFEIKRKIANNNIDNFSEAFKNKIINDKESRFWFKNFTSYLYAITKNEKFYHFDISNDTIRENYERKNDSKLNMMINFIMKKYINNLGLIIKSKKDKSEIFIMTLLEKFVNPKSEENTVGKESIQSKDPIGLKKFDTSTYFYAKDKNNNPFYLMNKLDGNQDKRYNILQKYSDTNSLWFKPKYKYAYDSNLAIAITNNFSHRNFSKQIPNPKNKNIINNLIYKIVPYEDSGYAKTKEGKDSIINEWLFSDNSPFIIAGTAKSIHSNLLSLAINLIFPFLFCYSIILLILLSNLLSHFINKPIIIYQNAIEDLKENNLGLTIQSFSKDEFNTITNAFNEMSIALKQKEQIKRFVSENLIQTIENDEIQKSKESKIEKVTILTSDIRNFTGISEKYEPYVIVEMLNSYFTQMQQAISENGGIIDKYIGDAIHAVFYYIPNKENQVIRASRAAILMRKKLKELNEERTLNGLFTIENGIGIDTDNAIIGTIGTLEGRKDFSVNGDVIGKAEELEAKTKKTNSKILISKNSIDLVGSNHRLITKDFDDEALELIDVK